MADSATIPTAAPQPGASAPAGQPGGGGQTQSSVPVGYRTISDGDYEKLTRASQQYDGVRPYYEAGAKHGLKTATDFDRIAPLLAFTKERNIDPAKFVESFGKPETDPPKPQDGFTREDVAKLIGESETKFRTETAQSQHDAAFKTELEELSDDRVKKIVGDKAPAALLELVSEAVWSKYQKSRQVYPEGHPLAGRLGLGGRETIEKVNKWVTDALPLINAHFLGQIGKSARTVTSTPAGDTAATGQPTKPAAGDPDARRTRLEGMASKILARKHGAPT